MIWQAVRCPPVRIDQSCWNLEQHSKLLLMVCFILQSPPHIDSEPVSFITPGSCPPFQSEHTADLCSLRRGSNSGQGHPQHRVAHIPPETVREVFPFRGVKIAKQAPTHCVPGNFLIWSKFSSRVCELSNGMEKHTQSHQYELPVYRPVAPVSIFDGKDPQGDKKEKERKKPLPHSVGK